MLYVFQTITYLMAMYISSSLSSYETMSIHSPMTLENMTMAYPLQIHHGMEISYHTSLHTKMHPNKESTLEQRVSR